MKASHGSLVGTVLDGRYRVTSRIARGGMATVFLATDNRLDREVAVKVMHPHLAEDPQFVARFHREARAAAGMSHPNVVAVFDQGHDGDVVYLVMEYVPGTNLRDLMSDRGALTVGETLEVLEPLLDALGAAHRAGVVHRDVKPENLLITADGRVKVADFGLARAASTSNSSATTGMLMGTAAYLSPELVTRGIADARSDVYAVGIMAFEMLTGRQPFVGEVPIQVAFQHVNDEVPAPTSLDPGLPSPVNEIVTWATARDPDLRPRDAAELAALVRQVRDGLSDEQLDRLPAALPQTTAVSPTPTHPPTAHLQSGWGLTPGQDEVPARAAGGYEPGSTQTDLGALPSGRADAPHRGTRPIEPAEGHQHAVPVSAGPPADDDGPTRRRRGLPILIALVSLAVILGGIGWYFTAGPGAYMTMPKVTGTAEQAKATLAKHGLSMAQVDQYSEDVPAGQVVATDPKAGQDVRKSGTVNVIISQGSAWTVATDIVDYSPEGATEKLSADGLTLGEVTGEEYSESIDKGNIVSQAPAAGERIRKGDAVTIVVSKGREPISVPKVSGKSADDAQAALEAVGLKMRQTGDFSETVPAGVVISQNPNSGTLFRGDNVTVVVSQGPPLVPVPNTLNMKTAQAVQTLQAAGFQVDQQRILGGALDTVREQTPPGGTAPKGSTVVIKIV